MLSVSALYRYPLKSVRGEAFSTLPLDAMGVAGDRRWMVVDEQGRFLSQRRCARMCLVQAEFQNRCLTLTAADRAPLQITVAQAQQGRRCVVEVWGDRVEALDCGELAAQWWSDFLGRDCRLVYMADDCRRAIDPAQADGGIVSFADRYPLLLISEASLADLNQRLDTPVAMPRFRPNIVVTGCEAYAEDDWQRIRIGAVEFELAGACARCAIPAIDPATARPQKAVLTVLNSYRRRDQQVYFGQNLIHRQAGTIALGDGVEVIA